MSAAVESIAPSKETQEFLARPHKLLIGGQWVDGSSAEHFEVIDPATEAHLTTVPCGNADDVDRAVSAARAALKGEWSKITSHERSRLIWALADELEKNLHLATELEVLDNGMPRDIAMYSIAMAGVNHLRYYAGWPTKIHGQTIPVSPGGAANGESLTYTRREPIGVDPAPPGPGRIGACVKVGAVAVAPPPMTISCVLVTFPRQFSAVIVMVLVPGEPHCALTLPLVVLST